MSGAEEKDSNAIKELCAKARISAQTYGRIVQSSGFDEFGIPPVGRERGHPGRDRGSSMRENGDYVGALETDNLYVAWLIGTTVG